MIIKKISLANFRCYSQYHLDFKERTTQILGENGSGKTTVLEGIYEAMRGKSFRSVDTEIMKREEEFYRVELEYCDGEKMVVTYDGKKKQFLAGDKKYGRLPKKYRFPVVLFLPEDLNLITASPAHKRRYFDEMLAQLSERYAKTLSHYNKALKQRNELLKREYVSGEDMFSWNVLLANYGCEIRRLRIELVKQINEKITEVYRSIAENKDEVAINYIGPERIDEGEFLAELERNFVVDRAVGHTMVGVQKDNYEFIFNNSLASGSASRGETRSIIIALKFIEAEMILKIIGKRPVVLLDDVFSELDATRREALVKNFKENQIVLTSVK